MRLLPPVVLCTVAAPAFRGRAAFVDRSVNQ
jgi:hypothetical protein